MKKSLKMIAMAAVLVMAMAAGMAGSSLAYFTSEDAGGDTYPVGTIHTDIIEENGDYTVKQPYVTNNGEVECLVRMRYTISPSQVVRVSGTDAAAWAPASTESGAGVWYYYSGVLQPGETTGEPLFTTVALNDGFTDADLANVKINLDQEAVQASVTLAKDVTVTVGGVKTTLAKGTVVTDAAAIWALYDQGALGD